LLVDLGLIAIATIFALVLRDNLEVSAARLQQLLPYLAMTLTAATVVLLASGLHQSIWRFSVMADYLRVVVSVLIIVLATLAFGFLVDRLESVARALPVIQGLLMAFLLVGVRVAMRLRHTSRHRPPADELASPIAAGHETILVVGINSVTDLFLRSVAEFAPEHMRVAGILGRSERHSGRRLQQHRILGMPEDIESILRTLDVHGMTVNRIVVTMAFAALSPAAQRALLQVEATSDIRLDLFAERIGLAERSERLPAPDPAREPSHDDGEPVTYSMPELEAVARRGYLRSKRIFDLAAAAVFLVLTLPLILLVGLVVALDVGLPTVFWQQRPGARGVPFKLYKFRTMRNAHDHRGVRIPDAQRLSGIGRFLRRTRLDELPQLYNILIGDMACVGPRPLLRGDETSAYAARLLVPPGLTGWAQVNGARDMAAQDKAALDVWYLRNASLWLDIAILGRTIPTILFGERMQAEAVRQAWHELAGSRLLATGHKTAAARGARPPGGSGTGRWQHAA
jgi:lipopolysaccharide/colanic/teichoic acid biosynthesis glycosyltransferase